MFNSTKPRRKPVFVLLLVLLTATGLGTATAHDSPAVQHPTLFTDVHSDSYYVTAVDWMVQNEITTGTSPTTFHPERNVTRGEAAAFLWRLSCRPEPETPHSFSDVHAGWQQQPVSWLQQHGAAPVQGTDDPADVFGPATLLTRAQIAALLYQLFGDDAQQETVSPFVDVTEPWQTAPVLWLLANQITTGTSDTTFHPDRNVTRGEFATFLWRHSQHPDPAQRNCQPLTAVEPEPVDNAVLRALMVAEDFARVSKFLTDVQAGCRPWADAVTNRCVLDTQDGLQLCFGWVTARNGLGWEPCLRHVGHDGTGRATETITDDNPMFHLRHNSLFGFVDEGLCATSDCSWAAVTDPARVAVGCARFWQANSHLTPGHGGLVCGPPDGCVRWYVVVTDRCNLDGVLWCHYNSGLWHECSQQPTALQPSGLPCPSTADADWVNRGRLMAATLEKVSKHQIVLTPGLWRFTLCVRGNHHERTQSEAELGGTGFEVRGPWRFDYPGPNGDPSFDGWGITPHHTDPGAGDCLDPASEGQRYTHMFCVVSADDWDHHRVMTVTSTGQNPPFITHLKPSNRRFQSGYWEITATKIS